MYVRRDMRLNGHLRLLPMQKYVDPAHREHWVAQQRHEQGMEESEGVGGDLDGSGDLKGQRGDEDGPPDVECTFWREGDGDDGGAELDVGSDAGAYAVEIWA